MTTPTTTPTEIDHEADLFDTDGDLWVFVGFRDHDGQSMYDMTGLGRDATDHEVEQARADITDPPDYWAHEPGSQLREDGATERVRTTPPTPAATLPAPAPEPAPEPVSMLTPDMIGSDGDHWTYVGMWDGQPHYVCEYPHNPAGPTDEQRSRLREHYNPRNHPMRPAHPRDSLVRRWSPLTERPRTVHDPRVDPPAPAVLPPDLVDRVQDVWVYLGELDGAARYVCAGREARLRPAEIEDTRRRPPQAGITRARIESDWSPLTERPRTAPEPAVEATVEPAAGLEPDLETDARVWVYTGTHDGVRRYRAIAKNDIGTPVEDVEDVRRRFTGGQYQFPEGSVTEGYVRSGVRVWERPRDLGHVVDASVAAQQAAPEPAPAEVTAQGWALDADGLPVVPETGPAEVRVAAATARAEALAEKLAEFKIKTRREVLAAQDRNGWCQPGTARVLEDLDLDKINAIRRATVTVTVEISGTNSDQNAETFLRNKIDRAAREALGDRLRGAPRLSISDVRVSRHED